MVTRAQTWAARALTLGGALAVIALAWAFAADRAGAGGADSAAVRGYIVPTPNNPDVDPAATCDATFTANDQSDDQPQSSPGTADNAVTLAGCSYDTVPFEGPSTENRPVVFEVDSGPGGLLCGPTTQQSQSCALPGINFPAAAEYRVLANNERGVNPSGVMRVVFCADDPPVTGACGPDDEQSTAYTIRWDPDGGSGGGGGAGAKCAGKEATIVASGPVTKGTGQDDVIVGRKGKDKIAGKGGKDRICGGGGKDKLKGGGGKDRLSGGAGADKLNGGGGKDVCKGGPGKDQLSSCEKGS